MEAPSYVNRRGRRVVVTVTRHALVRFAERWHRVFPNKRIDDCVEETLLAHFARARRFEPKTRRYRQRLEDHGKDTLFFAARPFVFVVQDAALMTVELATRDTRRLNHKPRPPTPLTPTPLQTAPPPPTPTPPTPTPLPLQTTPPAPTPRRGEEPVPSGGRFRASGHALDENGTVRQVSLGRYPPNGGTDDATAFVGDRELMAVMLERIAQKRPGWRLISVFLRRANRGPPVTVLDETDFWVESERPSQSGSPENAPGAEERKASA